MRWVTHLQSAVQVPVRRFDRLRVPLFVGVPSITSPQIPPLPARRGEIEGDEPTLRLPSEV
jgi:hypothetical protein